MQTTVCSIKLLICPHHLLVISESSTFIPFLNALKAKLGIMDKIGKNNIVHKLQKRKLLIAINCLAGLSIFFFGYDQGE